jgi:hypothetical protein|tara:strand:+ start:438 stop:746 length:309 start_codon:yes stop_codon:yes gene_type:complete
MIREYKHHNPKLYIPLMKELLNSLGKDWYDSCYGNDLVASVSKNINNNHVMTIYLPNSKKSDVDNELFNTFEICENVFKSHDSISCESVGEVIKRITQIEEE